MIDLSVKALAIGTLLSILLRLPVRPIVYWSISGILALLFITQLAFASHAPEFNFDFHLFRVTGRDVLTGRDPYAQENFDAHPFLNPPSALPLFALFALIPSGVSGALWTVVNIVFCLSLAFLCHQVLRATEEDRSRQEFRSGLRTCGTGFQSCPSMDRIGILSHVLKRLLSCARAEWPAVCAVVSAVLALSDVSLTCIYTGQLGFFAAVVLMMALYNRSSGQPIGAGIWLALGTVKVATLLPFLLLFCRGFERRILVSFAVAVAGLCLLTTPPKELLTRCSSLVAHITELSAPGQVNDYSFEGTQHLHLLGFDRALYCLGLRNRQLIQLSQMLILATIGAWVANCVLGRRRLPEAAAASLVALFSAVFLYHRPYDAMILTLPLLYSTNLALSTSGSARVLSMATVGCILVVLFLSRDFLRTAFECSKEGGLVGWLIQVTILPCATWAIVLAMFCLVAAARRVQNV